MVLNGVSPKDPTTAQLVHYGATNAYLMLGPMVASADRDVRSCWSPPYRHQYVVPLEPRTAGGAAAGPAWPNRGVSNHWDRGKSAQPLLQRAPPHDYISVGAGASGAVFGIAGILIVLLSNKKLPIPAFELNRLRRSVIQFAVLNLIIGIGANYTSIVRIDNHAHIGGFLSGLALGVPLVPRMTSGRTRYLQRQKLTFAGATFCCSCSPTS